MWNPDVVGMAVLLDPRLRGDDNLSYRDDKISYRDDKIIIRVYSRVFAVSQERFH